MINYPTHWKHKQPIYCAVCGEYVTAMTVQQYTRYKKKSLCHFCVYCEQPQDIKLFSRKKN